MEGILASRRGKKSRKECSRKEAQKRKFEFAVGGRGARPVLVKKVQTVPVF
jgi:hypothetical protein